MTLNEIKQAVDNGTKVYWSNPSYEVIKDKNGQYLIVRKSTGFAMSLTWADGTILSGKEYEYFIINNQ